MNFAEVAVDAPAGHNRTFSYSIPHDLNVSCGQTVKVPFGPRILHGIVFDTVSTPQVKETRDIIETSARPLLVSHQLRLARWISNYYMCSLYEAAAPMLPPGGRSRPRTFYSIGKPFDHALSQRITGQQSRVLDYISKYEVVEAKKLARALGHNSIGVADRLAARGMLEARIRISQKSMAHKVSEHFALNVAMIEEIEKWLRDARKRSPRQAAFVEDLLKCDHPQSATKLRKQFGWQIVSKVRKRGWLIVNKIKVDRDPLRGQTFHVSPDISLTEHQQTITDIINHSLEFPTQLPRTMLIQGVTGSGKTEVYLAAVKRCLELGRKAIVMVPEIALTQQTIERFAARFPNKIAVLHSGISPGEKFDQWWKIREGVYDVVIGSRSAIFAPISNLGLIVIDEEHEWTYKQQDINPRYHAKDVANHLAELTQSIVLLGSASPDVSSYFQGLTNRYQLFFLPDRINVSSDGKPKPKSLAHVDIIDMRDELKRGNRGMFSRQLDAEMEACLAAGNQMILFLNRRGTASQLQCRNCGHQIQCKRCDITLTVHGDKNRLICHYCGSRHRIPDSCPACLRYKLSYYGIGTQSVMAALEQRFPSTEILRWDRDTARNIGDYREIIRKFKAGDAPILIGTQMIAKGLHFPSVTLVGAVLADFGLAIPDYRATERNFQLLCQVAGRSGRGDLPGKVIIQTYQPNNHAIQSAATQNYHKFYTREMEYRRQNGNPPINKLIRLLYTNPDQSSCEREANNLARHIRHTCNTHGIGDTEILGPVPAFPSRLRGKYRWHIVLRGPNPRTLLDQVNLSGNWYVDVDPVTLV